MNTTEPPKPTVLRRFKRWLLLVLVLVVLHFLSSGPALVLAQRRLISTDLVETFLTPVWTGAETVLGGLGPEAIPGVLGIADPCAGELKRIWVET
jgi:hypothetical protein